MAYYEKFWLIMKNYKVNQAKFFVFRIKPTLFIIWYYSSFALIFLGLEYILIINTLRVFKLRFNTNFQYIFGCKYTKSRKYIVCAICVGYFGAFDLWESRIANIMFMISFTLRHMIYFKKFCSWCIWIDIRTSMDIRRNIFHPLSWTLSINFN